MTEILKASHTGRPRVLQPAGKLPPEWSGNGVISPVCRASPRPPAGSRARHCVSQTNMETCVQKGITLHLNLKNLVPFSKSHRKQGASLHINTLITNFPDCLYCISNPVPPSAAHQLPPPRRPAAPQRSTSQHETLGRSATLSLLTKHQLASTFARRRQSDVKMEISIARLFSFGAEVCE